MLASYHMVFYRVLFVTWTWCFCIRCLHPNRRPHALLQHISTSHAYCLHHTLVLHHVSTSHVHITQCSTSLFYISCLHHTNIILHVSTSHVYSSQFSKSRFYITCVHHCFVYITFLHHISTSHFVLPGTSYFVQI